MYAGRGYRRPLTGSTFGFSLSRKGSGKFYPIFSDPPILGSREGKGARYVSRSPGKEHIYKRAPGSSHLEPGIFLLPPRSFLPPARSAPPIFHRTSRLASRVSFTVHSGARRSKLAGEAGVWDKIPCGVIIQRNRSSPYAQARPQSDYRRSASGIGTLVLAGDRRRTGSPASCSGAGAAVHRQSCRPAHDIQERSGPEG